ncbi:hypothetical protein SESBI_50308 [Sesbania bispinosa]|nr:hypothetical protein SESBI_50308 [Sesbania bispinosa]
MENVDIGETVKEAVVNEHDGGGYQNVAPLTSDEEPNKFGLNHWMVVGDIQSTLEGLELSVDHVDDLMKRMKKQMEELNQRTDGRLLELNTKSDIIKSRILHLEYAVKKSFQTKDEALKESQGTNQRLDELKETINSMMNKLVQLESVMNVYIPKEDDIFTNSQLQISNNFQEWRGPSKSSERPPTVKKGPLQGEDKKVTFVDISDDEVNNDTLSEQNPEKVETGSLNKQKPISPFHRFFIQSERERLYGAGAFSEPVQLRSEYRRRPNDNISAQGDMDESSLAVKKLSFTPFIKGTELKVPKVEPNSNYTPSKRDSTALATPGNLSDKGKGVGVITSTDATKGRKVLRTKVFKTKFKMTPDMQLNTEERFISAYVFQQDSDPSEIIFNMGNISATMKEFECLIPDRTISDKKDVRCGMTIEEFIDKYSKEWKPIYDEPERCQDASCHGHPL